METSPKTTGAANALLCTASAVSNLQPHHAMTAEALLLAVLCDPALTEPDAPIPEESELRRAILASDARPEKDGWSSVAWAAYLRAWQRASARERTRPIGDRVRAALGAVASGSSVVPVVLSIPGTLSVGDIVHGLSGSSGFIDDVLRSRAIDPSRFDGEAELPEVGYPANLADEAVVDVIALDDDVTPMHFVVDALQRHFGLEPLRATYLMYRVHACKRARVATCNRRLAEQRIDAVHEAARPLNFPLAFVYGARVR